MYNKTVKPINYPAGNLSLVPSSPEVE